MIKLNNLAVKLLCLPISLSCVAAAISQTGNAPRRSTIAQDSQKYADDTLIITLKPGADMEAVKETINEVHGTVVRTMHVDAGNYSILFVKPEAGKVDETMKEINDKQDKNFKSISRNRVLHRGGNARKVQLPDDPFYYEQWNLASINWTQARTDFMNSFRKVPNVVDLDSGVQPIFEKHELSNVVQYNSLNGNSEPFLETPFDDMINYNGAPGHGTACYDTYGAATANGVDTAGAASFSGNNVPREYEFRCLDSNDDASNASLISALTYIVNNQSKLGGPSPVNISIYGENPPLYDSEPYISLAQSLYSQGSLAVFCSGDSGKDNSKYSVGYSRVVQGTNSTDKLGRGTDKSDYIGNNTAAAPGYGVYLMWGNHQLLYSYGTSFASPTWAGCIAVLQSISPGLTAPQADTILFNTARSVQSPPPGKSSPLYTLRIPNLDAAIKAL